VLDELHQDSSRTLGMKKRDEMAPCSGAGLGVDELDAGVGEEVQVFGKILAAVGDVVEAGSTAVEKPADRGVGTKGLDELQLAAEGDADPLGDDGLGRGEAAPGEPLVKRDGPVEGRNRDGHVVERTAVRGEGVHGSPVQRQVRDKALAAW